MKDELTNLKGEQGVSITSVEQTTSSTVDGGTNVITVTLSNGTTSTFNIRNGTKGAAGINATTTAVATTSANGLMSKEMVQKLGTIDGITSDINSESDTIAASSKMVHDLNDSLGLYTTFYSHYTRENGFYVNPDIGVVQKYNDICIMSFEIYNGGHSSVNANENILVGNIDIHPKLKVTFPVSIMYGGNYVSSGIIFIDTNGNMYVNTNKTITSYANIYGIAIFWI